MSFTQRLGEYVDSGSSNPKILVEICDTIEQELSYDQISSALILMSRLGSEDARYYTIIHTLERGDVDKYVRSVSRNIVEISSNDKEIAAVLLMRLLNSGYEKMLTDAISKISDKKVLVELARFIESEFPGYEFPQSIVVALRQT